MIAWIILTFILGYTAAYFVMKKANKTNWYKLPDIVADDLKPVGKGEIIQVNKTAVKIKEATGDINLADVIDLE